MSTVMSDAAVNKLEPGELEVMVDIMKGGTGDVGPPKTNFERAVEEFGDDASVRLVSAVAGMLDEADKRAGETNARLLELLETGRTQMDEVATELERTRARYYEVTRELHQNHQRTVPASVADEMADLLIAKTRLLNETSDRALKLEMAIRQTLECKRLPAKVSAALVKALEP